MSARTFHVLVAEDEAPAAQLIARFLGSETLRVSTVGSGNAAIRRLLCDPADLVVTDLRMPDGDGLELIRSVRDLRTDMPIIVMTGQVLRDAETDALEAGASIVVRKPVDLAALTDAVKACLAGR